MTDAYEGEKPTGAALRKLMKKAQANLQGAARGLIEGRISSGEADSSKTLEQAILSSMAGTTGPQKGRLRLAEMLNKGISKVGYTGYACIAYLGSIAVGMATGAAIGGAVGLIPGILLGALVGGIIGVRCRHYACFWA